MLGTTASHTNKPLQHFSNLQMYCPGKHKTRFNRGDPKDLSCCCNSRSFSHNPTQLVDLKRWTVYLDLGIAQHACITRWNEHLLWLSAPSHRPPAAKHWNRSHMWDRRTMANGNIENRGGITQFWQITYPLIPICSRVQITFHRTFRLLRVWNAQPKPLVHFIDLLFVLVSFVVLILRNRGQTVYFASSGTGWERVGLIT